MPARKMADMRNEQGLMKDIVRTLRWLCWIAAVPTGWSQVSLGDASLEDLLRIQVTSVSKKEQTLPDLLRTVPGVNVAQIDANAWAITIRGMNGRYSNKVLVLLDGRAVYTT